MPLTQSTLERLLPGAHPNIHARHAAVQTYWNALEESMAVERVEGERQIYRAHRPESDEISFSIDSNFRLPPGVLVNVSATFMFEDSECYRLFVRFASPKTGIKYDTAYNRPSVVRLLKHMQHATTADMFRIRFGVTELCWPEEEE